MVSVLNQTFLLIIIFYHTSYLIINFSNLLHDKLNNIKKEFFCFKLHRQFISLLKYILERWNLPLF